MSTPVSEPLPSLVDRLRPPAQGQTEFVALVQQLLRPDATEPHLEEGGDPAAFVYSPVIVVRRVEELEGIAHFVPVWGPGPDDPGAGTVLEERLLPELVAFYVPPAGRRHIVLVFPTDPIPDEDRWFARLNRVLA